VANRTRILGELLKTLAQQGLSLAVDDPFNVPVQKVVGSDRSGDSGVWFPLPLSCKVFRIHLQSEVLYATESLVKAKRHGDGIEQCRPDLSPELVKRVDLSGQRSPAFEHRLLQLHHRRW
jgi:hypothetical protein